MTGLKAAIPFLIYVSLAILAGLLSGKGRFRFTG